MHWHVGRKAKGMKIGAIPLFVIALVAISHCSGGGNANGCPNAKDISYGGSCSVEGVVCDALYFCNSGAPSQALCKDGAWTTPPGCIEGGANPPCTQLGGVCSGTCPAGTHAITAADACEGFMDSCCIPGDGGDAGGDASDGDASSD
jgi:hypothetical protein